MTADTQLTCDRACSTIRLPVDVGGVEAITTQLRGIMILRALVVGAALGAISLSGAVTANAAPYKNCTEARANGDTNIPASSDKYGSHLDRDGDGIGYES